MLGREKERQAHNPQSTPHPPTSKWVEGDDIHFKTAGNSMFLKSFYHAKMGDFSHLEGGQVMAQLSIVSDSVARRGLEQVVVGGSGVDLMISQHTSHLPKDQAQGVDPDEWNDDDDDED